MNTEARATPRARTPSFHQVHERRGGKTAIAARAAQTPRGAAHQGSQLPGGTRPSRGARRMRGTNIAEPRMSDQPVTRRAVSPAFMAIFADTPYAPHARHAPTRRRSPWR